MRLLDHVFAPKSHLTRPNFDESKIVRLTYSGLVLEMADAPHTAFTPLVDTIESLDLYRQDRFGPDHNGDYTVKFYSRSWELRRRKEGGIGATRVTGRLLYFPDFPKKDFSCFRKKDFEAEILTFCHDVWGWQNKGAALGSLGDGQQIYPTTAQELSYRKIGKATWCTFTSQRRGEPPRVEFAVPVTAEHILVFDFTLSAFDGVDFYGPETNLKESCFQIVKDFMSNVKIELPTRSKAEHAAIPEEKRTPAPHPLFPPPEARQTGN